MKHIPGETPRREMFVQCVHYLCELCHAANPLIERENTTDSSFWHRVNYRRYSRHGKKYGGPKLLRCTAQELHRFRKLLGW